MIKQQHSSAFQLRNPYRLDRPSFSAADLYDNQDLCEFLDLDLLQSLSSPRTLQDPNQSQQQQTSHGRHRHGRPLPPQPENSDKRRDPRSTNSQDSQRPVSKSPTDTYHEHDPQPPDLSVHKAEEHSGDVDEQQKPQQQQQRSRNRVTGAMKRLRRTSSTLKKDQSRLKGSGLVGPRPLLDPVATTTTTSTMDHQHHGRGGNGEELASPTPPLPPPIPSITITQHIDSHDELTFERHVEWLTQTALWWDMPVVHLYPAPTGKASIDYVETAASRFSSWVNFVKIDAKYGDGGYVAATGQLQHHTLQTFHHHHHNAGLRLSYSKLPQKEHRHQQQRQQHQSLARRPSVEEGGLVGSSHQSQQPSSLPGQHHKVAQKIDPIIGYVFVGSQDEQTQYQQVFDTMEVLFPMIEIRYINSFDSSQPQRHMDSCLQSLGWIHYWSAAKESQVLQSKIVNEIVRVRPMWVDPNSLHRNYTPMPCYGAGEDDQSNEYVDDDAFDQEQQDPAPASDDQGHLVSSVSISSMVSDMCLDDDMNGALNISARPLNHSDSDLLFTQRLYRTNSLNGDDDEMESADDGFFEQPLFHDLQLQRRQSVFLTRTQSFSDFELPPLSLDDDDMENAFARLVSGHQAPAEAATVEASPPLHQQDDRQDDHVVIAEDVDLPLLPKSPKPGRPQRPTLRREQSRFRFLGRDRRAVSLPDLTEAVPKTVALSQQQQQQLSEEQLVLVTSKAQPSIATSTDSAVSSSLIASSSSSSSEAEDVSLLDGMSVVTAATASPTQTNASLSNKLVGFVQRLAVYRIRGSMMVFDM